MERNVLLSGIQLYYELGILKYISLFINKLLLIYSLLSQSETAILLALLAAIVTFPLRFLINLYYN